MILGFDGKRAASNFTGLGNYSRLVIDTLSHALPEAQLLVYAPRPPLTERGRSVANEPNVEFRHPDKPLWRRFHGLWRVDRGLTAQLRRDGVELFHGLSNELPLDIAKARIPSVVTIHDLIFRHYTDGYKPIDRLIYDYKFQRAAENSTRIIAISEATRRDIISSYGISPEKIDVVYQGCHPSFTRPVKPESIENVKRKYRLPDRYIASVGTIEPRKNQLLTIKALEALPADVKLVVVGRETSYAKELRKYVSTHRLGSRVIFIHNMPFAELPPLYAGAQLSAYTSRIEGFGIPVIESINCGTPVLACTGTCLEEAGGPGALYVHPDDVEEAANAASRLLDDTSLRADMTSAGRRYVEKFSHANFAQGLLSTYTKAINEYQS